MNIFSYKPKQQNLCFGDSYSPKDLLRERFVHNFSFDLDT